MNTLTLWQYIKLNKQTTLSCLKICSLLFAGIATIISLLVKYSKGAEEDPFIVFITCELFGFGFAVFIFMLALVEGYTKARIIIDQYNTIPFRVREIHSLDLIQKPLNPKYWFTQFQIVHRINGKYYELSEDMKKEILS